MFRFLAILSLVASAAAKEENDTLYPNVFDNHNEETAST
jgi:hypothetical protein